ncbi:MAG: phosphoadenosine phosphosulfate reductase family protein [Anaerolineae bacterium]|nr:phosphoadenosine phosphosulfate reductase family protein [Anaerolineae bacterium]
MHQLPLFPVDDPDPLEETPDPLTLLRNGAALVLSVSGGKDSDAMSHHVLDIRQSEGWPGDIVMVHADLGARVEWQQTPEYVRNLARRKGVPLHVVRWQHGDLIDRIWQRYHKDPSRPCWPSAKMRYCTADLKRSPCNRWLRNHFPSGDVICAMGLRAQESHARARRKTFTLRTDASAPTKGRYVYDWLPIHDWTETDVWDCIQRHGNVYHKAYTYGNQRLSCALCVLASLNDLINGAVHNPDTYREYCRIEAVTGYSFRKDFWLSDLKPELLPQETLAAVRIHQRKTT